MLSFGLSGTHVLITGANRGIGKTVAETFLSEGANVSYCSRSATGSEFEAFLASKFSEGNAPQAVGTKVDVSNSQQVESWVAAAAEKFGRIDTIVANVSVAEIRDSSLSAWEHSIATDLLGVVAFCGAAQPHLIKTAALDPGSRPSPSIVVVSSIAGISTALGGATPYGPLKAAQNRYAMALAKDLGPQGVRVNCIAPGTIDTPAISQLFDAPGGAQMREMVVGQIPLGRLGQTQDIANAVAFLASPLARWVTGSIFYADGGFSRYC